MLRIIVMAGLVSALGIGSAFGQSTCAAKAISEDGKPLAGAARTSFIKKCCEDSALDSNGRPLEGDAKASYLAKCEADDSFSAPPSRG